MTIAMLETEYCLEAEALSGWLFFPLPHFQSKPAGSWAVWGPEDRSQQITLLSGRRRRTWISQSRGHTGFGWTSECWSSDPIRVHLDLPSSCLPALIPWAQGGIPGWKPEPGMCDVPKDGQGRALEPANRGTWWLFGTCLPRFSGRIELEGAWAFILCSG